MCGRQETYKSIINTHRIRILGSKWPMSLLPPKSSIDGMGN